MWQIQWMLSLIPDAILNWLYWGIIAAGITGISAGWLSKWIPVYGKYIGIIKPLGIALLVLGCWLRGGYDVEMSWRDKVKEVEAKLEIAKKESDDANKKLEAKSKEKQKVRVEYYATVKERIVEKEKLIDAECKLDPVVPKIHNEAATNPAKVNKEEVKK